MPEPITTTSYDASNRQLTFGDKILAYDDNGNLQSITDSNGTTLYSWNARNQLVGISGPSVNASFVYDGVERRQKKNINGSLTEFLYDELNPVQESAGATVLANILSSLGIDEFLTRTDVVASVTSNFLADTLGSAVALTDNAGAVQIEYLYESFGRTNATGASNNSSYQYTGRENDVTGLYYYRTRFYHPNLQRFVSEDPIDFAGGLNLYAYVENNPINLTDPSGLCPGPFTFTDHGTAQREGGKPPVRLLKFVSCVLYRTEEVKVLGKCYEICFYLCTDRWEWFEPETKRTYRGGGSYPRSYRFERPCKDKCL